MKSKRRVWRILMAALLLLIAAWSVSAFALYRVMHRPPESFARAMSRLPDAVFLTFPFETLWTDARSGTLHTGDRAPDFSLMKLDHSGRVQLSSLTAQHPVVLIFGSYT